MLISYMHSRRANAAEPRQRLCRAAQWHPRQSRDIVAVYETCCSPVRHLRSRQNHPGKIQKMRSINRRMMLAETSAVALLGHAPAWAQGAASGDTDWTHYANDLASTRYSPLDQINAANFNQLEMAWRFSTNALGPRLDADYQSTPLVVKGRLYCTAGFRRDVVCLDAGTGELLWMHTH